MAIASSSRVIELVSNSKNPKLEILKLIGNLATVKFRQVYASDRLSSNSRKTLVMEKQGNKWQIKQEHAGS